MLAHLHPDAQCLKWHILTLNALFSVNSSFLSDIELTFLP